MPNSRLYKDFEIEQVSHKKLSKYVDLLNECFPEFNVSYQYLEWLYFQNPLGNVVGFDALQKGEIVAHYACIPTRISGVNNLALLSLNTATTANYRGRGLFKVLAESTYQIATQLNFSAVVGVANGNSHLAFTRHLAFEHLGYLDLRFGLLARSKLGSRVYTEDDLIWRCDSSLHKFRYHLATMGRVNLSAKIFSGVKLRAMVFVSNESATGSWPRKFGITVDWRRGKKPLIFLPTKLKPSPLALIFRSLDGTPSSSLTSWSFPDFDAF